MRIIKQERPGSKKFEYMLVVSKQNRQTSRWTDIRTGGSIKL